MTPDLCRPPVAARLIGCSVRKLYYIAESDPDFPRKIVLSSRCVGWRRESLEAWLRAKEIEAAGGDA